MKISKQHLFKIMFQTWDSLNEDMEVFQAMWDGLISDAENIRFVTRIEDEGINTFCQDYFDGNVRECFYDYINNQANKTLETFTRFAEPFFEEVNVSESGLHNSFANPKNAA